MFRSSETPPLIAGKIFGFGPFPEKNSDFYGKRHFNKRPLNKTIPFAVQSENG